MTTPDLRARSAFEIIDAGIQVFRRHYPTFVMIGAVASVPLWIVMWSSGILTVTGRLQMGSTDPFSALNFGAGTFALLGFASYLWLYIVNGAMIIAASDAYLQGTIDPTRALLTAFSRAPAMILAGILYILASMVGVLFFIVGAFYVFARYFAVVPVVLLENEGAVEAFHRSRDLSKGFKWRIFGTFVLAWLMVVIVAIALQLVVSLLPVTPVAGALLNAVVQLFVSPVVAIVLTVLYYDQRIRKEGFDLEMLAQQLTPVRAGN